MPAKFILIVVGTTFVTTAAQTSTTTGDLIASHEESDRVRGHRSQGPKNEL